jgi:F0F1-type ATP synthase epsilon subunit
MRNHAKYRPPFNSRRRGIATLEFAMALPVLLLLMVAITWLGFSVIGQAEVLITARNNAWKQRFDDKAKRPLMFPSGVSVAKNPFYSTEADYVTEKADKKVDVSPIFNRVPGPEASHTILAGSWDHRAMPFDKPPEWKLMATAAASGTGGRLQTWLTNLNDPLGRLKDVGSSILAENARRMTEIDSSNAASDSNAASANQAKQQTERDRQADKRKYQQRLQQLGGRVNPFTNKVIVTVQGGELDQTIDEIDRLETELNGKEKLPTSTDPEQAKKQKADLERDKRELELLKGKRERIESEIRDTEAELDALD